MTTRSLYLETRLIPTVKEGEKVRIEAGGARYIFTACEVIDPDFQRLYLEEIECLPTKNAEPG